MNANEIEVGHVPGTMRLSECKGVNPNWHDSDADPAAVTTKSIVLQPTPSADPRDPLVLTRPTIGKASSPPAN